MPSAKKSLADVGSGANLKILRPQNNQTGRDRPDASKRKGVRVGGKAIASQFEGKLVLMERQDPTFHFEKGKNGSLDDILRGGTETRFPE